MPAPKVGPDRIPLVTVSYAQTLDGRLATASGSSQWISGPESLVFVHQLRAAHDAIMVGVGTVLRDDPRLTVRLAPGRDPLRVVVDSELRTPLTAAVLADGAAHGTLLAVTSRASKERCSAAASLGAAVLCLPDIGSRVDLLALLLALETRGIGSVMVEGGARLITALFRARLVHQVAITVAPKILGAGLEAVGDLGIRDLAHAVKLEDVRVTSHGADQVVQGQVVYTEADSGS